MAHLPGGALPTTRFGAWLAAGDLEGGINLFERSTAGFQKLQTLSTSSATITAIAFGERRGELVLGAASEDGVVRLFRLSGDAWELRAELEGHDAKVRSIAFSIPDAQWVVIEDGTHALPAEYSDEIAEHLQDFLGALPSPPP